MLYWSCWTFGRRVFFNSMQTSTRALLCDRGRANMHHREETLVAQQQLSTLDWTRGKVTLANNVCIAGDKQKSSSRWMFPCYRGIRVTFIERLLKMLFFLFCFFIGVSCIYSCLRLKFACLRLCSCAKKTKSDLLARKEPDWCKFVCLFVCFFSPVGPHVLTHSTAKAAAAAAAGPLKWWRRPRLWSFMIKYGTFVRANVRLRVLKRM